MNHTSELPLPPREVIPSIPEGLEAIVLHALEKTPAARPADAAEFRRELLAMAERLGLEYAAITSAPDLQSLRDVGTQTPSGRLVVDLARLRENRAAATNANELTVISASRAPEIVQETAGAANLRTGYSFPRVSVQLGQTFDRAKQKPLALLALLLVLAAVGTVGFLTWRSWHPAAPVVEQAIVTPTPTPTPEATPTPTPAPSPTREPRKPPANANKKSESKVGSALRKVGRILKKPF